jgi:hypothetical protein
MHFVWFFLAALEEYDIIPSWLPLPWSDIGDFIDVPNGDVYANSEFFARIIRTDQSGHFIASYPYPDEQGHAHYTRLAVGHDHRIYLERPRTIYTCSPDMRVVAEFSRAACTYWTLNQEGQVVCVTSQNQPSRVHRIVLPGEPMFTFGGGKMRETFQSQEGVILTRTSGGLVKQFQGTVIAAYRSHWLLRSFVFPWPGILFFVVSWGGFLVLREHEKDVKQKVESGIDLIISRLITPFFHRRLLCPHCLCYTHPFQSQYTQGKRYCEHCEYEVESIGVTKKLIFTFGTVSLEPDETKMIFSNPGFQLMKQPMDVSEIYIDTITCDPIRLERFMTYILNYPPRQGINTIHIFYQGSLDNLGHNLKHVVHNTFKHITHIY